MIDIYLFFTKLFNIQLFKGGGRVPSCCINFDFTCIKKIVITTSSEIVSKIIIHRHFLLWTYNLIHNMRKKPNFKNVIIKI